jgi:hypothetical protein
MMISNSYFQWPDVIQLTSTIVESFTGIIIIQYMNILK